MLLHYSAAVAMARADRSAWPQFRGVLLDLQVCAYAFMPGKVPNGMQSVKRSGTAEFTGTSALLDDLSSRKCAVMNTFAFISQFVMPLPLRHLMSVF